MQHALDFLPLLQDPDGQKYDVMRRELTFEAKGKVLICCQWFNTRALDCCQSLLCDVLQHTAFWL